MVIESFADVSAGKITLHFKLSYVDSVKGKCVMVNDGVVPGGSGAVISKVGALRVGAVRKPAGKVIDALPQAVRDFETILAACNPFEGELAGYCLAARKIFSFVISPLTRNRSDENSASVIWITILFRHGCLWLVACRA